MLVFFKASDRPCSKTFYALVALKILFLNSPGDSLRNIIFNKYHSCIKIYCCMQFGYSNSAAVWKKAVADFLNKSILPYSGKTM